MNKPVNEIFYSLQGEGFYSGRPAIFMRFSGCNLHCPFCDTDHRSHTMMDNDAIIQAIKDYPADFVVLTGGEPALYVDAAFVDCLHRNGKYVAIETNGTRPLPDNIDWVTLSPKTDFCPNAEVVLERADEVKIVFLGQDVEKYRSMWNASHYYLQPCGVDDVDENRENLRRCVAYCLAHPQWEVSVQLHKLLNIR